MRGQRRGRALLVAIALTLAACGDRGVTTTSQEARDPSTTSQDGSSRAAPAPVVRVAETPHGAALVDADGMTLYLFTRDEPGKSNCTGACAQTWPPLTVDGAPTAGTGVDGARLSTFDRGGGTPQVAFGGVPLYRYTPDEEPGDTKGHAVGGVWFVVGPDGKPAGDTAPSEPGY